MSNHDLDWLAAHRPQPMPTERGAHDRALLALIEHRTSESTSRGFDAGSLLRRPWGLSRTWGLAAATGLAAIAAAVVLATGGGDDQQLNQNGGAVHAAVQHVTHQSPLVRLADYVSTSATPAGDATLVQRTTHTGGQNVTVYDLYGDNGSYYFAQQESGLPAQVSAGHTQGGGQFGREVSAAKLAAAGDVMQAAEDMADAPDPGHPVSRTQESNIATIAAKLNAMGDKHAAEQLQRQAGPIGNPFDNWAWEDSQDAIIAGSGDPQVRAGVLKILATLPGVTVTQDTSGGQPTLVLSSGPQETGSGYTEQLTINAETGIPIRFAGGRTGADPATTVDYRVARVTLSDLAAGRVPSL